ncbi:response regulator [Devosia rhizoryzae]|uniref:Response regulator n=1 Tax=Devosia rhizoryzae TaxID=2774137 RepID=A0ABX7C5G8_9HYPH|nr:response regulator [Devosia rhizoryzae]QQR39458.1 response regulator [Devosia rhizoryzae]
MIEWLFVDDVPDDRASFVDALEIANILQIAAISGLEAKSMLADKRMAPAGVLMDVDLSNEQGMQGTGLGLAFDIRSAQYRGALPSFPIIRFSLREVVKQNVGHDTSSDDAFDLKIYKDDVKKDGHLSSMQCWMRGTSAIYAAIGPNVDFLNAAGVTASQWEAWGDVSFVDALRYADRPHLKAACFVQLISTPGLLIDETLLATRLGVAPGSTGYAAVLKELEVFRYTGVGADFFPRWWARGLEVWWDQEINPDVPLSGASLSERVTELQARFGEFQQLSMPESSPGNRPWRLCSLSMERSGEFLPVDPIWAVPFRPRMLPAEWADPTYAALGVAAKDADNPQLDGGELERQLKRYRKN